MKTARLLASLAVLLCAASVEAATPVSSYPERPIRVIVPFGPGTGTDILARTLTEDLRAGLGWNFVVDNRAGGSAQIAAELAAKAPPDGYTLFQFMFVDIASSQSHVKAGRLRAIGVMSDQRSKLMPDLPAVGETVPGFDTTPWAGFFVPAGTSKAIISRLSSETVNWGRKIRDAGIQPE